MALGEKIKKLFSNKPLSTNEADEFIKTEEGENWLVSVIQKEMPSWFKETVKPTETETEKVENKASGEITTVDKEE